VQNLSFLGLSDKETQVYLALLQSGEMGVKQLSLVTKIDRTTLYSVLEGLIGKDLASQREKGKVFSFSAHDPKNLLYGIRSQEAKLKEVLPELLDVYRKGSGRIYVRSYHGREDIAKLYESILDTPKLVRYDIICSERDWLFLNPKFFKQFKKRRAQKGIRTRLVMETSPTAHERKAGEANDLSQVKLLPPAFSPLNFSGGCYILPDRTIFIAYRQEQAAVEIFSKEINNFMQNIFEFLWKAIA